MTSPIRRVSAWATNPAAPAIRMERTQMYTTRPSTSARSGGTRASDSDGPREGATGNPSVVCPLTISLGTSCSFFEEHGRSRAADAQLPDELPQAQRQRLAIR